MPLGCTDSNALNYDSEATMDDDTCIYPCLEDEFVSSNACVPCPEGFINDSGDDPTGFDTQCDEVIENEYTVDVLYESDADIAGFQFNVDGADLISVSGGAADAAGFTVSSGGSTVLGFSFTGASIPAGSGVLTTITVSSENACLSDLVLSGVGGTTLADAEVLDCSTISYALEHTDVIGCTDSDTICDCLETVQPFYSHAIMGNGQ